MTFQQYQEQSRVTAKYPDSGQNFVYPTLGLVGEAGEVAEKIKKALRDHAGVVDEARKKEIMEELGDVLWYMAQLSTELGLDLEDVAAGNLAKLRSRMERGQLSGSGDDR